MSLKLTGAELKQFNDDPSIWPEGAWWDDFSLTINGREIVDPGDVNISELADEDEIVFSGGDIYGMPGCEKLLNAETVLANWLNDRTHVIITLDVKKSCEADALAAIAAIPGVTIRHS